MNQKKAKNLRRKAFNLWSAFKGDAKKRISVKTVYKHLKKEYKKK